MSKMESILVLTHADESGSALTRASLEAVAAARELAPKAFRFADHSASSRLTRPVPRLLSAQPRPASSPSPVKLSLRPATLPTPPHAKLSAAPRKPHSYSRRRVRVSRAWLQA